MSPPRFSPTVSGTGWSCGVTRAFAANYAPHGRNHGLMTASVPESWKNTHIILIHKKGDTKDSKNYSPISLLSLVYKVLAKVIANRTSVNLTSKQGFLKAIQQWTTFTRSIR